MPIINRNIASIIIAMALINVCTCLPQTTRADQPPYLVVYSSTDQCGYPEWAPDGQSLLITAGATREEEGDLWVIPLAGGEPWQLTIGGGHHGVFSPDGSLVVYDGERGSVIRLIPATGGPVVRVVPESVHIERSGNPCWSPDGTRIIFRVDSCLQVLTLASGVIEPMFEAEGMVPMPIHWLDTGEVLAGMIDKAAGTAELYRVPLDGGDPAQITEAGRVTQAGVSPDGELIVYSAQIVGEESGYDLWVTTIDGAPPVRLVHDMDSHDLEPAWSPGGDEIAYVRYDGEQFEVVVLPVDTQAIETMLAVGEPAD